jgi:hypothetical protein
MALVYIAWQQQARFINNNGEITFDKVGIFRTVQIPCPANVQCGPMYQLSTDDGNSYTLLFTSNAALPSEGERVEVTGTVTYNTSASCGLNGQPVPCQPIGTVQVSGWKPA